MCAWVSVHDLWWPSAPLFGGSCRDRPTDRYIVDLDASPVPPSTHARARRENTETPTNMMISLCITLSAAALQPPRMQMGWLPRIFSPRRLATSSDLEPSSLDLEAFRKARDIKLEQRRQRQPFPAQPPRPGLARGAAVGGCGIRPCTPRARLIQCDARMGLLDSFSAFVDGLNGDNMGLNAEADAAIEALCRPQGWTCKCEIGSSVARSVGGSGQLASGPTTSTAALSLRLAFAVDEGYQPPQGRCMLLSPSKFLSDEVPTRGFWKVDDDGEDGFPRQVQWRLHTKEAEGLVLGGDVLLPPGSVYFNAKCAMRTDGSGMITLGDGRITIKEDLGSDFIFQAKGILAEFKIVGTFECVPSVE